MSLSGEEAYARVRLAAEAMLWLEGKRALDLGEEIRGMRKTS